jgi:predicted RecB family nuclease
LTYKLYIAKQSNFVTKFGLMSLNHTHTHTHTHTQSIDYVQMCVHLPVCVRILFTSKQLLLV